LAKKAVIVLAKKRNFRLSV